MTEFGTPERRHGAVARLRQLLGAWQNGLWKALLDIILQLADAADEFEIAADLMAARKGIQPSRTAPKQLRRHGQNGEKPGGLVTDVDGVVRRAPICVIEGRPQTEDATASRRVLGVMSVCSVRPPAGTDCQTRLGLSAGLRRQWFIRGRGQSNSAGAEPAGPTLRMIS